MLSTNEITLSFGAKKLFEDVNLSFCEGNCYGIIGANGHGGILEQVVGHEHK